MSPKRKNYHLESFTIQASELKRYDRIVFKRWTWEVDQKMTVSFKDAQHILVRVTYIGGALHGQKTTQLYNLDDTLQVMRSVKNSSERG